MIVLRPGQRVYHVPDFGVTVHQPGGGAAADWWDPDGSIGAANVAGAWAAKGAASYAASKVNLANPGTYDLSEIVGPVAWSAENGWGPFTDECFNTGYIPANYAGSYIFQFSNSVAQTKTLFGSYSVGAGDSIQMFPRYSYGGEVGTTYINDSYIVVLPQIASGNLCIADRSCYRNGALDGTLGAAAGNPTLALYIGTRNRDGAGDFGLQFDGYIKSVAFYVSAITAPQVAMVVAAQGAL